MWVLAKAANNPVQTVDWYDCVKWSNARSKHAGLTPVYYTDAGLTQVYTIGETTNVFANWAANGYRLPTEAEWEKAARGGLSGQRFPWGNTISESQANYHGNTASYSYDLGPNGYNAIGNYRYYLTWHESSRFVSGEWVWAKRHGWGCLGVVLGLVCDAVWSTQQYESNGTRRAIEQPCAARRRLVRLCQCRTVCLSQPLQPERLQHQRRWLSVCEGALVFAFLTSAIPLKIRAWDGH